MKKKKKNKFLGLLTILEENWLFLFLFTDVWMAKINSSANQFKQNLGEVLKKQLIKYFLLKILKCFSIFSLANEIAIKFLIIF